MLWKICPRLTLNWKSKKVEFSNSQNRIFFWTISSLLSVDPEIGVASEPDLSGEKSLDGDRLDGIMIKREAEVGIKSLFLMILGKYSN